MSDADMIRTSCSRSLIVELAERLGVSAANPDVVLVAALAKFKPKHVPGTGLWQEHA
jgi:hypothetical protein